MRNNKVIVENVSTQYVMSVCIVCNFILKSPHTMNCECYVTIAVDVLDCNASQNNC